MHVRVLIQSAVDETLTVEATETAHADLEEKVSDGYELIQAHNATPRGGRVIATAQILES